MGKLLHFPTRCLWFRVIDSQVTQPLDFFETARPCGTCTRCGEWIEFLHAAVDPETRDLCLAQIATPAQSTLPAPATGS